MFQGDKSVSWKSDWPLPPGRYVAALIRGGSSRPWPVLDVSPPFEIRFTKVSQTLINFVRDDIAQVIKDDVEMAAKFLRLGFHDSVGGPDGCVRIFLCLRSSTLDNIFQVISRCGSERTHRLT